jgi:hypothetical protein
MTDLEKECEKHCIHKQGEIAGKHGRYVQAATMENYYRCCNCGKYSVGHSYEWSAADPSDALEKPEGAG